MRAMCTQPSTPPRPFNFRPRPVGPFQYSIRAIPGVVDAGAEWKLICVTIGNSADGMLGLSDGSVLSAQNDNSSVVRITADGHTPQLSIGIPRPAARSTRCGSSSFLSAH